jgi:hypothetical protein
MISLLIELLPKETQDSKEKLLANHQEQYQSPKSTQTK